MPNLESKQVVIDKIKEDLQGASSVVLVDARGLTVGQDTVMRRELREAGVVYKIYKNSLIKFAIKDTEFEGITDVLAGPTAIAISYEDPTAAPAILAKHAKEIEALEFKAGVVDGVTYDKEGITKIASIPSRDVLLSKLFGSFKAPIGAFARVIKAIADEKDAA